MLNTEKKPPTFPVSTQLKDVRVAIRPECAKGANQDSCFSGEFFVLTNPNSTGVGSVCVQEGHIYDQ